MSATLTIDLRECDTLHGLLSRCLLILVENPSGLAKVEGITVAELYERLADDLRLMEDIGWASEADRESVGLTMPREKLAETLKRLRRDARRAPLSPRHEREPKEGVDERWRRFRQAVEVCEELLCGLASSAQDDADPEPTSAVSPEDAVRHELAAYYPVTDGFVLAALERAELHEQEAEALTSALMAHLGFKWAPPTNRLFFPRLEELRQAGLSTSIQRRGEPYWGPRPGRRNVAAWDTQPGKEQGGNA